MTATTPDRVCANRPVDLKIKVRPLPENPALVWIEAGAEGFRFLAELFAAHADAEDCGFEISPAGPGSAAFASGSTIGFFLHRIPCEETER
jgi:hypothetical protein